VTLVVRLACLGGIVALAGCFSPDYARCAVQCGAAEACPSATTCGDDGYCHADGDPATCGLALLGDAGGDRADADPAAPDADPSAPDADPSAPDADPTCEPTCADEHACGDDGCGGDCGTCPESDEETTWLCGDEGQCCIDTFTYCDGEGELDRCCPGLECYKGAFCFPIGLVPPPGRVPGG
jgi:hypothetical protein